MDRSLFAQLTNLLGRRIDDSELLAFLEQVGAKPPKNSTDNNSTTHAVAKKLGLEMGFSHIVHDRTKHPPKKEERRYVTYFTCAWLREAFPGPLPGELDGAKTRADLEKRYGAPTWTMYDDDDGLPMRERFLVASSATWTLGCEWSRNLGVSNVHVALREPRDLGDDGIAIGMFAAWAALRAGLGKRHARSHEAASLLAKQITGREFVRQACEGHLWSDDIAPALEDFAYGYCHAAFDESEVWRKAARAPDGVGLHGDFEATFSECNPDFELVPDTWPAWERLAPLLDARWADYQATKYRVAPAATLYAEARAAQDKAKKTTGKLKPPPPEAADAAEDLTDRLQALIGKPSTDAAVVALSRELGLRLPKKHEDVPDTTRGFWIDYEKATGKKTFTVRGITFLPQGRHQVRFDGDLRFAGYTGQLPCGIAFQDPRRSLTAKLGKPTDSDEDSIEWLFRKEKRRLIVWFEKGKIQSVSWLNATQGR
ncbi:MAG: hypothetical protein CVU63_08405 [Deltaproteobacteria bacterium HGW-Deltaproteobacteria-20]|nr:MAG: hypothetical protein CVU63_08405 [Deltaproteobacteria bacterium HGW-Deltaproteobacteria-20]